ncbi:type II toxin-antitoxin system HipA family toxin [Corynebacterium phocae]|nr:HipA domain-containing protein [Corynebacterium phocae]KAA8722228.1 type II toxin-antitoxin system HipA family toxin [Corynebacterium phocae]
MPALSADVFVGASKAATLKLHPDGTTTFAYTPAALTSHGPQVAFSLPVTDAPVRTPGGALPAFFTNLLPEGGRLAALQRQAKASLDNELPLLLEVGGNTVGNISVLPTGQLTQDQLPDATVAQLKLGPELDFSQVPTAAGIVDPAALPGVQDKASAYMLSTRGAQSYILKVSPPNQPALVENEAACFQIAAGLGKALPQAEAKVIHDKHGRSGLLVTRFDRSGDDRLHAEDAAQLLNIPPALKYQPTMEEVAHAVAGVCTAPRPALAKIAYMTALAWLTGNGDMHAKNISVLSTDGKVDVAPLYDIPSTLAYGDNDLALSVGGATTNLSGKRFLEFTREIGLPEKVGGTIMARCLKATDGAAERIIAATGYDPRRQRDLKRVLAKRRQHWG